MIVCSNCETPQCLQITVSKVWVDEGDFTEVIEKYECTLCGGTGTYSMDSDTERLSGTVTHKPTLPLTMEAFS